MPPLSWTDFFLSQSQWIHEWKCLWVCVKLLQWELSEGTRVTVAPIIAFDRIVHISVSLSANVWALVWKESMNRDAALLQFGLYIKILAKSLPHFQSYGCRTHNFAFCHVQEEWTKFCTPRISYSCSAVISAFSSVCQLIYLHFSIFFCVSLPFWNRAGLGDEFSAFRWADDSHHNGVSLLPSPHICWACTVYYTALYINVSLKVLPWSLNNLYAVNPDNVFNI